MAKFYQNFHNQESLTGTLVIGPSPDYTSFWYRAEPQNTEWHFQRNDNAKS